MRSISNQVECKDLALGHLVKEGTADKAKVVLCLEEATEYGQLTLECDDI